MFVVVPAMVFEYLIGVYNSALCPSRQGGGAGEPNKSNREGEVEDDEDKENHVADEGNNRIKYRNVIVEFVGEFFALASPPPRRSSILNGNPTVSRG